MKEALSIQGFFPFRRSNMIHQNDDILYQAASVWKNLTEYHYIITYGYKNKLYTLNLTFSPEDFPHLAGFQYLRDLSLPRYNFV